MKIKLKKFIHMACNCGKKNVSQPIVKSPSRQKNIIGGTGNSGSVIRRIIRRAK